MSNLQGLETDSFRYHPGVQDYIELLILISLMVFLFVGASNFSVIGALIGVIPPLIVCLDKFVVRRVGTMTLGEEGISFYHPVSWFNWQQGWSDVTGAYWAKGFLGSVITLERKPKKNKDLEIKRWRIEGEAMHANPEEFSLYQTVQNYVDLNFLSKVQIKEKKKQLWNQDVKGIELGKVAEKMSYIALAIIVVDILLGMHTIKWTSLGGNEAVIASLLAGGAAIWAVWYLYKNECPLVGLIIITGLNFAGVFFLSLILMRLQVIYFGEDIQGAFQLDKQAKKLQVWTDVRQQLPDLKVDMMDTWEQKYTDLGQVVDFSLKQGIFGNLLISDDQELSKVRQTEAVWKAKKGMPEN